MLRLQIDARVNEAQFGARDTNSACTKTEWGCAAVSGRREAMLSILRSQVGKNKRECNPALRCAYVTWPLSRFLSGA